MPYPGAPCEGGLNSKSRSFADSSGHVRSFCVGREDIGLPASCFSGKYKVIVFDTETSGGTQNRVVELGAYAVESGEKFCTLVNPGPSVVVGPLA